MLMIFPLHKIQILSSWFCSLTRRKKRQQDSPVRSKLFSLLFISSLGLFCLPKTLCHSAAVVSAIVVCDSTKTLYISVHSARAGNALPLEVWNVYCRTSLLTGTWQTRNKHNCHHHTSYTCSQQLP